MKIYDELSIKWDGIKGRINTVYVGYDYEDDYDITYDVQLTDIMEDDEIKLFDNFVERAKKVEELLELKNMQIAVLKQDKGISHTQYINLLEQINNLEKELEGMKYNGKWFTGNETANKISGSK